MDKTKKTAKKPSGWDNLKNFFNGETPLKMPKGLVYYDLFPFMSFWLRVIILWAICITVTFAVQEGTGGTDSNAFKFAKAFSQLSSATSNSISVGLVVSLTLLITNGYANAGSIYAALPDPTVVFTAFTACVKPTGKKKSAKTAARYILLAWIFWENEQGGGCPISS